MPWQMGQLVLALTVYLIPDMKTLELTIGLLGILFLSLYFVMHESPRWLIAKNRGTEANEVIKKICEMNGREFKEFLPDSETQEIKKENVLHLMKYPGNFKPKYISKIHSIISILLVFTGHCTAIFLVLKCQCYRQMVKGHNNAGLF